MNAERGVKVERVKRKCFCTRYWTDLTELVTVPTKCLCCGVLFLVHNNPPFSNNFIS